MYNNPSSSQRCLLTLCQWHQSFYNSFTPTAMSSVTTLHAPRHLPLVWRSPVCSQRCKCLLCLPKSGLNNPKYNDKTTLSSGKFSWFLERQYFDNSFNVNHWHKIPKIDRNDKEPHNCVSKVVNPCNTLILKIERWQAMPPFPWQMVIYFKNGLIKNDFFQASEN